MLLDKESNGIARHTTFLLGKTINEKRAGDVLTHLHVHNGSLQINVPRNYCNTCDLFALDRGRVLSWLSPALLSGSRWYSMASIKSAMAWEFP